MIVRLFFVFLLFFVVVNLMESIWSATFLKHLSLGKAVKSQQLSCESNHGFCHDSFFIGYIIYVNNIRHGCWCSTNTQSFENHHEKLKQLIGKCLEMKMTRKEKSKFETEHPIDWTRFFALVRSKRQLNPLKPRHRHDDDDSTTTSFPLGHHQQHNCDR